MTLETFTRRMDAHKSAFVGGDQGGERELLPALFWDGSEDWINEENCADFAALQSLKFDDQTPEERAEDYKGKGNHALKYRHNKIYVRKAVQHYTLALLEEFDNAPLRSVLYSNRAHAALLLGNFGKALDDAKESIRLDPKNIKGWFRAAKSALALEKIDECVNFATRGLEIEETNRDLHVLLKNANKLFERHAEHSRREQKSLLQVDMFLSEAAKRSLKFGPAVMGTGQHLPELSRDEAVMTHWVLLVYPESMQTDVIERFDERITIAEQLDDMFGEQAPPLEWDNAKAYAREALELYYQSHAVTAYPTDVLKSLLLENFQGTRGDATSSGEGTWNESAVDHRDQHMILIDERMTLGEVLAADDHIIPGHPVLYVVSKRTKFKTKFVAGEWEL